MTSGNALISPTYLMRPRCTGRVILRPTIHVSGDAVFPSSLGAGAQRQGQQYRLLLDGCGSDWSWVLSPCQLHPCYTPGGVRARPLACQSACMYLSPQLIGPCLMTPLAEAGVVIRLLYTRQKSATARKLSTRV